MATTEEIRANVVGALTEALNIKNQELRDQVYDAWTMALERNGFTKIEEMDHSGRPGMFFSTDKTQLDHIQAVGRMAADVARTMNAIFPNLQVDVDEAIAGGLCHDVGKPGEYNRESRKRWAANPGAEGLPGERHTFYGYHIALCAGLPATIAHVAAMHAGEGEIVNRSVVAEIVHWVDDAYWHILLSAGLVEAGKPK